MARNLVSGMLREGLYTRAVGKRIFYHRRISSTMDEAERLAIGGVEEGAVILSEEQTGGRGRFQRQWISQPGNLYVSIVLRPSLQGLPYVSMICGVAAARAIRKSTGLMPTIKWPNDVRIGGKKVCGILVQNTLQDNHVQYAIVGIGVNVSLDPIAVGLGDIATSLNIEAGRTVDRQALLRRLLQELDDLYLPLRGPLGVTSSTDPRNASRDPTLEGAISEWRSLLETLGQRVTVRWGEEVYSGLAEDVDGVGNLLLRTPDGGLLTLPAGEVTSRTEASDN